MRAGRDSCPVQLNHHSERLIREDLEVEVQVNELQRSWLSWGVTGIPRRGQ